MTIEEYKKENYFANVVLGAIENVKVPMLMYEEEKEVVKLMDDGSIEPLDEV